jgi:hypothetical protein
MNGASPLRGLGAGPSTPHQLQPDHHEETPAATCLRSNKGMIDTVPAP